MLRFSRIIFGAVALSVVAVPVSWTSEWSENAEVRQRLTAVVTYRAKLEGNVLIVEATHGEGWHTYAMDNIERARKKSGKESPETELPTRLDVAGGLALDGAWYQTDPKELSQLDIKWYTWGWDSVARFAAKVKRVSGDPATITINGQACNASLCSMVDGVTLTLPVPSAEDFGSAESDFDFSTLVEAVPGNQSLLRED